MKCLVVGGAGYIGSHMVKHLMRSGHDVFVFDNLSTGFSDSVQYAQLIVGDLNDQAFIEAVLREKQIEAVFHFASSTHVGASHIDPADYYRNNVVNTLNLLDAMRAAQVMRMIFSSTAAVYGEPQIIPIPEDHPRQPINPYGRTKAMVEDILRDYHTAYGLQSFSLRYFNAAGAHRDGECGERHHPETHLIPLALQVASGRRSSIAIFGRDYDTPDGTCIRDYIHVSDIAAAHEMAVAKLLDEGGCHVCNLGTGHGYSVAEVIAAVARVTRCAIACEDQPRRPGDPAQLVADPSRARHLLGWQPYVSDLDTIITHAWAWEQKQVRLCR